MKKYLLLIPLLCLLASPVWAFPDNGLLDDFTGCTDTTTPPNANWTNTVLRGATSSTVDCEDTAATATTTGTEADMYWHATTFNADSEAYGTVVGTLAGFVSAAVGVRMVNIGASTTDGYMVKVSDGLATIVIERIDNGTSTEIATEAQTITSGDSFGIRAEGSSICSWYKLAAGGWTQIECATDATYTAGGNLGVMVQGNGAVGALDDVGGGNLAAAAGVLQSPALPSVLFQE